MNVLSVLPYSPVPADFGGALREFHLLKALCKEHTVTVLCYGTEDQKKLFLDKFENDIEELHMVDQPVGRKFRRVAQLISVFSKKSYYQIQNTSKLMQNKITELLTTRDFDAVHCEFSVMGNFDITGDAFRVMDTHNVEYENFRRMWKSTKSGIRKWFYKREYEKVFREEIEALQNQDLIFSTSNEDRKLMMENVRDIPNIVVPNGVETRFFTPKTDTDPKPNTIVFTGMMAYYPNDDGMRYFLKEVFPHIEKEIPNVKVYIVGKRPTEALKKMASENVIVTGFVEDVRPYVWKSSVFVVPLRMGSGTRLKVVEALSMKKPVVSTSLGCEGILVENNHSILIEDEPEAFARSVIKLLRDKDLRVCLGKNGYEIVVNNYDWEKIGSKMLKAYKRLKNDTESNSEKYSMSDSILHT